VYNLVFQQVCESRSDCIGVISAHLLSKSAGPPSVLVFSLESVINWLWWYRGCSHRGPGDGEMGTHGDILCTLNFCLLLGPSISVSVCSFFNYDSWTQHGKCL